LLKGFEVRISVTVNFETIEHQSGSEQVLGELNKKKFVV
jgi:hypothetical protein